MTETAPPDLSVTRANDLEYWQLRSALGYSIPIWVDEKWPNMVMGLNPFKCGKCDAHRQFPGLHISQDIRWAHDNCDLHTWEDVNDRVRLAFSELGYALKDRAEP